MELEELKKVLIEESKAVEGYVIDTRRQIHMYPETKFEEDLQQKENEIEDLKKELQTTNSDKYVEIESLKNERPDNKITEFRKNQLKAVAKN